MPIGLDAEILDSLRRYLDKQMTLREFEDWFIPKAWDVESSNNPVAESLGLAEYTNHHLSADELREKLRQLVSDHLADPSGTSARNSYHSP
jgi:hypothetical protein